MLEDADEHMVVLRSRQNGTQTVGAFFVQPVDSRRCVIRGVLNGAAQGAERIAVLRQHNERLSKLRDAAERRRSMRGEGRGFLLDRLRLARHRASEHLVHARDRNDLEPTLDAVRDFDKILGVLFGNEHSLDATTQGREQLLF